MFLGLDDLGQHGELLGSQNLCNFAVERGWHHFMASEWALGWLSSPLLPARVPWESSLWTTPHLWPCFLLGPQSPSFAFQYWSGAWKRWGWMKPPWDPSWGLNYSFGCWHWAVPFTELNYTAPGIVLRWSSEPGQVCGHSSWGCSPGTAPPTGLGGSVSKVWKSTRGFLKHNWFQEILKNVDGWGYGMLISLYSSRTARSFIKRNE